MIKKRTCKSPDNTSNFLYSCSNILKNLYDSYNQGKLSFFEKKEIKKMIFLKDPKISKIFENLKTPEFFNSNIDLLKSFLNNSTENPEKSPPLIKKKIISQIFSKNAKSFFGDIFQNLDQSLTIDSNESILILENSKQNLFSDDDLVNLSTTEELKKITNDSTNPSTPIKCRKYKIKTPKNHKIENIKILPFSEKKLFSFDNFLLNLKKKIRTKKIYKIDDYEDNLIAKN